MITRHCSLLPRSLRLDSVLLVTLLLILVSSFSKTSAYSFRLRMVEGHGCHRVVAAHRRLLLGHVFQATSPNGRFLEGAKLIDGKRLARVEAVGKNLFYFWTPAAILPGTPPPPVVKRGTGKRKPIEIATSSEETVVMHVHFGMSGAFSVSPFPGKVATPTTRLFLVNKERNLTASLSAMTCVHGGLELFEGKLEALGPDPLREDADKERLWGKMQATSKAIGQILMDQSCVAGIGNIYRAEILFKSGVHPEQPANTVAHAAFETLWMHSVLLLQRGFTSGSILTVDPSEASRLGPPWTRRYIYNHSHCGRCGSRIQNWSMAGRTVYCCPSCQPLSPGTQLAASRKQAVAVSTGVTEFVSHCAGEDAATLTPAKMTVPVLRAKLEALGLPVAGRKAELVARLTDGLLVAQAPVAGSVKEELGSRTGGWVSRLAVPFTPVKPGTLHLRRVASARAAALEKERAGENRAVEHVALHDEGVETEVEAESVDVVEEVWWHPSSASDGGSGRRLRNKRQRQGSPKIEWAADVAVIDQTDLMESILAAESE